VRVRSRCVVFLSALLSLAASAGAQERPVDPGALDREASRFGLQINGFAAGSFDYRFPTDENSFGGSTLAVSLFRALSDRVSFFGQLTVSQETASPFAGAEKPDPEKFDTEVDNLQVSWAASPRHGLSLTFGKFDSPLAIERDDAPLNLQATPSWVFQFARPVKFAGLMARQTFSPKFEGYAILANGWDVSSDNNKAKTGALYGVWSPLPIAHFGLGVIHGAEKDDRTGDPRTTAVATILVQQTPSWVWGEEFVYGTEPHSATDGGSGRWLGDMFFMHFRIGPHWALTARLDYFSDTDGARTGQPQVLRSFTVSPQYLVGGGFFGLYRYLERTSMTIPELALRLDLREDRSTESVFAGHGQEARRDSPSATLQVVYVF
jgi:putative OmpL-like beta-barrel porin-2